jgi:hypothetical protein
MCQFPRTIEGDKKQGASKCYQPWFLYEARTLSVISSVLFENSPWVPPIQRHRLVQ